MEYIKGINLFNGLSSIPNKKKESKSSTPFKSQKNFEEKKYSIPSEKSEPNTKRVLIEIQNSLPQKKTISNILMDKNISNIQDISTKEEDSSTATTVSKLPKIQKHLTSTSIYNFKENNNLTLSKSNNNIKEKDKESNLSIPNTKSTNSNITNNTNNTHAINAKNKVHNISSAHSTYYDHHLVNFKNYNSLIPPADPLLKRTIVPKVNPKFGKMKAHIMLPDFKGEEPLIKIEYKPVLKDIMKNITIEKQYEVSLYVNSMKMLNNLVYLKTKLSKEGLIVLENLINVKKLNRNYNNESEEEDDNEGQPMSDSLNNINALENINMNNEKENNNNNNNNNDTKFNSSKSNNTKLLKNISSLGLNRPKTVFGNKLKSFYTLKNKNDNTLIFESRFESGNLLCAFRTEDENSYQLYLQNDTNTTGYIQWFFFRVSNTKKGRKVNFNIINMLRKKCIYSHGLKIMTYSTMASMKENLGWHRAGTNTMYYPNNLYVFNSNNGTRRNLHSLSFDYEFKYDNDVVYFANCLPYFYSKLMKQLNNFELNEEKYPYFQRKTLATTLGGNDLDMFTINSMYDIYKNGPMNIIMPKSKNYLSLKKNNIGNNNGIVNNTQNNKNNNINNTSQIVDERQAVIIIARQHPGETVGSYVIQGCIDFLMGNSEEAKKLREIYLFKIVPMMNPDGVLVGNSRTSFAGCDLNRRWGKPSEIIHPEVFFTKNMILKLTLQRNIAFIIDCHGHFGTFNSLFYCNYKEDRRTCRLFPYLCSHLSKIISFQQSTFAMPRFKLNTERISLFNELDDDNNDNIVALETSFFGVNRNGEYARTYFTSKLLKEVGRDLCMGMLSYYYKVENMDIEINFFKNKENVKKLDVDMREFESEIIKEVNEEEEDNNNDINEEKSESEPSIDNLDKNQIMRLLPGGGKRRRRRKKNRNYNKKKDKNKDLNIELFNPIKEAQRRLEEERKKKLIAAKIVINCNNNNKANLQNLNSNTKNEYTQTEEIFFKMHWTYFSGQYKIIDCGPRLIYNNKNYFGISTNLFGQIRTKNDFYKNAVVNNYRNNNGLNNKRYGNYGKTNRNNENLNNSNNLNLLRPQSFNNKIIFNKKNIKPQQNNDNNNKNYNNINNLLNFSQKNNSIINNNNMSINNKINSDKNMNNKINFNQRNSQNNLNSNMKTNLDKNRLSYLGKNYQMRESNKSYSKDNKNSFNKTSSYFSNLFKAKQGNNS